MSAARSAQRNPHAGSLLLQLSAAPLGRDQVLSGAERRSGSGAAGSRRSRGRGGLRNRHRLLREVREPDARQRGGPDPSAGAAWRRWGCHRRGRSWGRGRRGRGRCWGWGRSRSRRWRHRRHGHATTTSAKHVLHELLGEVLSVAGRASPVGVQGRLPLRLGRRRGGLLLLLHHGHWRRGSRRGHRRGCGHWRRRSWSFWMSRTFYACDSNAVFRIEDFHRLCTLSYLRRRGGASRHPVGGRRAES